MRGGEEGWDGEREGGVMGCALKLIDVGGLEISIGVGLMMCERDAR